MSLAVTLSSCSATPHSSARSSHSLSVPDTAAATSEVVRPSASPHATSAPAASGSTSVPDRGVDVTLDLTAAGPIDPRLFGVNVPAWLGPERLADPAFVAEAMATGTTLVRMPGGSWSNSYRWWACEVGDEDGCFWTWAARPSDFAGFLEATGLEGMWTLSVNETAQSAAAAVAFFNGEVGDRTPIGVDRVGVDWGTVDRWARLRADGGHPEPVRIELWEIGNEVYGGRPDAGGDECASFGWEDVWTCDGREYVEGDEDHDGFLATRDAMLAVDPTIQVGAVGVADPDSWTGWGREVIESAGSALDFYVLHHYGFDASPSATDAASAPGDTWPDLVDGLGAVLGETPVAITEYNLVSFESGDTGRTMTTAINALYLADTLGRLVDQDVPIAAVWNLANGTTSSGTDYGLIDVDGGGRHPSFEAFRLWSSAGSERLRSATVGDVRLYPTRNADGHLVIISVNAGASTTVSMLVPGTRAGSALSIAGVVAATPAATNMEPHDGGRLAIVDDVVSVDVPAYSILVMRSEPDG